MAQTRKFGTFGGVFTPSILTILGVIMYLRLPYIVGQAGFYRTVGIILVAHVISVATGLCVSSIATDKRVRAGGTYYMISRSLGLPIGGTLGLALFAGMSFSISLYLIGFSESFLSYWGLPSDVNAIRISGTIALIAVATIALISTALALKMQYWIMAAIALSLISIVFGRHEFAPAEPLLQPPADGVPFIVLFGIFFPAVTGFEAGVSMSGDLRDPKRSIPVGTMSAIAVGLVVYIAFAAFLAFTVSADQLSGNARVLLDMALFSPLVVAGIWGATISSAFGSILGAPRILQATADDGVVPRWFAFGHGRDNEPRRALLLACLIAEAGILIGELNAIARIVTMFFIAAYGFLNLTATIESWVSPDFRPQFRVPRIVGVIGAGACLIVMIELDLLAMVGATVVLGSLYLYLARRQLRLESGDTWEGVWSTVARAALLRLERVKVQRRNWKPNLLLFSGGASARPHLVELGTALAGTRGLITDVELVATRDAAGSTDPAVMPRPERGGTLDDEGVFHRRIRCSDVYDGMADVARFYGFGGIEPNTVLLGWARSEPDRFSALVHTLAAEDLNVLLLDHDRDRGWGERRKVDVWWRLSGNDVAFSLVLIRALSLDDDWRDATIRFLTVNDGDPAFSAAVAREMRRVLEEFRVEADVRVINNAFDRRTFVDVLRSESVDADLTIMGVADVGAGDDGAQWILDTNDIVDRIGTTLIVHASSFFDEPLIRLPPRLEAPVLGDESAAAFERVGTTLSGASIDPAIAEMAARLDADLDDALSALWEDFVSKALRSTRALVGDIGDVTRSALASAFEYGRVPDREGRAVVAPLADRVLRRIETARSDDALVQNGLIDGAAEWLPERLSRSGIILAEELELTAPASTFGSFSGTPLRVIAIQAWLRTVARVRSQPVTWTVRPRVIANALVADFAASAIDEFMHGLGEDACRSIHDAQRLFGVAAEALASAHDGDTAEGALLAVLDEIHETARVAEFRLQSRLAELRAKTVREFVDAAARVDANAAVRQAGRLHARARVHTAELQESADRWSEVQPLIVNAFELDAHLVTLRESIALAGKRTRDRARDIIAGMVESLERLDAAISDPPADGPQDAVLEIAAGMQAGFDPARIVDPANSALQGVSARLPDVVAIVADETAEAVRVGHFEDASVTDVALRRVVEYLVETALLGPLRHELGSLAPSVDEAANVAREVAQLAAFRVNSRDNDDDSSSESPAGTLALERLRREVDRLRERADALDELIVRRFTAATHRFEPNNVVRVSARLDEYVRSQRGRRMIGGMRRTVDDVRTRITNAAVRVLHGRSEGALFASRLRREAAGHAGAEQLRQFVQDATPRPDVVARLPLFYRELFLGRPTITSDIHIGFDTELAEAALAVDQHRKGRGGALLVLGQPGQGRGTLASLIAHQHFDADRIFRVEPPRGGSIDTRVFAARLRTAIGGTGELAARLARVPGAVILLDDINLWWERSPGGAAVIDAIASVVARFGDSVLFIANVNQYAFRLMDRMQPIEHLFLRVVECEPFTAEQLQRLILMRHGATGLHFTYRGVPEERLTQWQLARLFNRVFDSSGGNIGAALNTWIAGITRVDEDGFEMVAPRKPALHAFDTLTRVQRMLAVQTVIHERLTLQRLQRITRLDQGSLARELRGLTRPGVLTEDDAGVIRIDRFVRSYLVRYLERSELV
ncbi:MAG TPA: hypothetical protein VMM79_02390 [Longimicrobiales bacterium]|nr:hypothetical protein [Longimicrobiales bacterium]